MNLLAIVQALHYEAKLPGPAPDATAGQTGRDADLVRWSIEAWNDIQRDKDGRWKWLLSNWTVDTAASTASYAFGAVTDVGDSAVITRFRAWDLDEEKPPLIYLTSDGKVAEREIFISHWNDFRGLYVRATHTAAEPSRMSVSPDDLLYLGPTPDAVYTFSGDYWKSNQELAVDADTPEMPANYHMLIVYRALIKYGYNIVAQEILARAQVDGMAIYDALLMNQWYGRSRIRLPAAIA